ncbi:hypothetical protein EB077_08620 [bacterium]|nr:hypothetical protein [bacterium]
MSSPNAKQVAKSQATPSAKRVAKAQATRVVKSQATPNAKRVAKPHATPSAKRVAPPVEGCVLCIDIGLKNLAMCALEGNTRSIVMWDTFNTLDNTVSTVCHGIKRDGGVCGKKCGYTYMDTEGVQQYACKTHCPNGSQPKMVQTKLVKDFLLQDIAKIVIDQISRFFVDYADVAKMVSGVLIELQPRMNNKMLFTSHIIYGKLVEMYNKINPKVTIRFVRASQKLKAYKGPIVPCNLKSSYAKRKYLSVEYTKWILEHQMPKAQCEKWLPFFIDHFKKDDLADTFLMAINGAKIS